MLRRLEQRTFSSVLPVSLADAKAHLRVDTSGDDSLITALIYSSSRACEKQAGITFLSEEFSDWLDMWPIGDVLRLLRGPRISVQAVRLYKNDSTYDTAAADTYYSAGGLTPIVSNLGGVWPSFERDIDGIEIRYTCGFGTAAADIPADIRQATLQTLAFLYENRGDLQSDVELPASIKLLLAAYKRQVML